MDLLKYGIALTPILLPRKDLSMEKWASLSCDQYTSQPEYWLAAYDFVGDAPSTLKLMQPEAFLADADKNLPGILNTMARYIEDGTLYELPEGMIYLERTTCENRTRRGLVCAIDLERYTFGERSDGLIRATEGVVMERIPPRLAIREKAPLEMPHVMILLDDPEDLVLGGLEKQKDALPVVYDSKLMLRCGAVRGWFVGEEKPLEKVAEALEMLLERAKKRSAAQSPMLMAVGDGNHSLVTAKCHWDRVKAGLSEAEKASHPARFALIELVNLHDAGLTFEPIHRVMFGADPAELTCAVARWAEGHAVEGGRDMTLTMVTRGGDENRELGPMSSSLTEAVLEEMFRDLKKEFPGLSMDYVHGEENVRSLVAQHEDAVGFLMAAFDRSALFPYVLEKGVLPKKTFSMGEADEKRCYLECRKIIRQAK